MNAIVYTQIVHNILKHMIADIRSANKYTHMGDNNDDEEKKTAEPLYQPSPKIPL